MEYNAGDNNTSGGIDDNGLNTNVSIANNVFVDGDNGDQFAAYIFNSYTYPHSLSQFVPVPGQVVDVGEARALTVSGEFRSPLILP